MDVFLIGSAVDELFENIIMSSKYFTKKKLLSYCAENFVNQMGTTIFMKLIEKGLFLKFAV